MKTLMKCRIGISSGSSLFAKVRISKSVVYKGLSIFKLTFFKILNSGIIPDYLNLYCMVREQIHCDLGIDLYTNIHYFNSSHAPKLYIQVYQ